MRRRLFWLLWNVVDKLDDAVHLLRAQVDRIEPPFVPRPLPETAWGTRTISCSRCKTTLVVPVVPGAPALDVWTVLETALTAHERKDHA